MRDTDALDVEYLKWLSVLGFFLLALLVERLATKKPNSIGFLPDSFVVRVATVSNPYKYIHIFQNPLSCERGFFKIYG
ncbi:hypothetical protein KBD33_02110, partial [Candidatus Gracilibacteria bacterium]|nr:hypothetical protein [Candidatus Gracilibacteria bacterium]